MLLNKIKANLTPDYEAMSTAKHAASSITMQQQCCLLYIAQTYIQIKCSVCGKSIRNGEKNTIRTYYLNTCMAQ
jgi:hypothetical protein